MKCDNNFDINTKNIKMMSTVKIFGYKNIDNTGPNMGCCGEYNVSLCFPCQYSIIMNLYKTTEHINLDVYQPNVCCGQN
ncbi:hypothetical protein HZS_7663 [Henneguya salminicola]|nr:hypothetical protein HZS_7663 [Henneguya salminicola]